MEKRPEARAMVRIYGADAMALKRAAEQTGRSLSQVMRSVILGREPELGLSSEIMILTRRKIARVCPGMSVGDVATELLTDWVEGRLKLDGEK